MDFLLGILLGYFLFSNKDEKREYGGVRVAKCTPVHKKPPSLEQSIELEGD